MAVERNREICICELCGASFFGDPRWDKLCIKCLTIKGQQEDDGGQNERE